MGSNSPHKIIVHHDGVSREGPSFAIINEYHKSRGFPLSSLGFYGGYHYLIERDGDVLQYRLETEIGAHTIGQNDCSIGICLAGNMDVELPTDAQVAALGPLLSAIAHRWNIHPEAIYPHRHFANKSCYGSRLPDDWAARVYLTSEIARLQRILARLQTS